MKCPRTLLETSGVLKAITTVMVATTERANSAPKHIKTPNRSTMGQERLNALLLLDIHIGIFSLNHEAYIDLLIYIPVITQEE